MRSAIAMITILFIAVTAFAQNKVPVNKNSTQSTAISGVNMHDAAYYKTTMVRATRMRNAGIILTSAAAGLYAAALISANANTRISPIFLTTWFCAINIGVPLWIAGGIKRKNNRKKIEQISKTLRISFGITNNGVGLVLQL